MATTRQHEFHHPKSRDVRDAGGNMVAVLHEPDDPCGQCDKAICYARSRDGGSECRLLSGHRGKHGNSGRSWRDD